MPVQINEIIVRAVIDPRPQPNTTKNQSANNCAPSGNTGMDPEMAEKIMDIIREKNER